MKTEFTSILKNAEARRTQRRAEQGIKNFLCGSPRPLRLCVSPPLAALLLCVLTLIPAAGHAATNDLTALLQQALFEEQANRNLDAAIEDYAALAKQFDKDRQLAATAVFRLGECYRAQGKTKEAAAQYQRILRDYSDQQTLATLSRQNLAGMGMAKTETAAVENADAQLLKRLEGRSFQELEKILPTVAPDATLDDLLQKRNGAQSKRASLVVEYATNNPAVTRVDALLAELNRQIGEKIAGMMQGLKLRAELSPSPQTAGNARQQQKELLSKQIALAEQDLAETQKLVQVGKAVPADTRAAEREVLRLRQQLAALDSNKPDLVNLSPPASSEEDKEIVRIQNMIQNSPDLINAQGGDGNTPLNKAAYNGWLKVAAFLLDHGADVNAGGIPPLNCAATAGNRAMTEVLLSRGANVNSKGSLGKTPLHTAVEKKFPAVAEVLLANKADVNAQDDFGNTPLVPAAEKKQVKIIQALLAAGANPNLENKNGQIPFSVAAASGSPEIVKLFLAAKADPNGGKLDAPLLAAIHAGDVESAELLLQAGANPNAKGEDDWQPSTLGAFGRPVGRGSESPIHLAVASGQLPMVQILLKFKADPNDSQTDGQSVLFEALADTKLLAALLEHGANPNVATDANRYSPLMRAASMGNAEIVALLLQHKADPNATDSGGNTALLNAVQKQSPAAVRALLAGGANPDNQTVNGYPALVLAVANTANKEVLTALIEAKANVNLPDPDGKTALHWAADKNRKDLIELLVKAGADVNARTKNGATPLDYAKSYDKSAGRGPGIGLPRPGLPQPLSYQWNKTGNQTATTNATSTADLLRQNGALDQLPDFTRIRITRQGLSQPVEVFHRRSTLTNHFTLLETVMRFYSFSQVYISGIGTQEAWRGLPFPDFGRVIIRRPSQKIGGKEQEIKVSLLNSSNVVDCAQDVAVQFGDVIEIPESVHALNAGMPNPVGEMEGSLKTGAPLNPEGSFAQRLQAITGKAGPYRSAAQCLQKSVQLVVAGETTTFKVNSWKEGFLSQALGKTEARSALRSSSDLSRVKVTRKTGNSAKPIVFTVDVSDSAQRNDDLWLQDGDVLEVPEKL